MRGVRESKPPASKRTDENDDACTCHLEVCCVLYTSSRSSTRSESRRPDTLALPFTIQYSMFIYLVRPQWLLSPRPYASRGDAVTDSQQAVRMQRCVWVHPRAVSRSKRFLTRMAGSAASLSPSNQPVAPGRRPSSENALNRTLCQIVLV